MKKVILPNVELVHVACGSLFERQNKTIFYMRTAIKIPWEELPKYINHEDSVIRSIIELRLKGHTLSDPGVQVSITSMGREIIETYVMSK